MFSLEALDGKTSQIAGHYALANLLQILARANDKKALTLFIDLNMLNQNPVKNLKDKIEQYYWDDLTRYFDPEGVLKLLEDPKGRAPSTYLYVPGNDLNGFKTLKKCEQQAENLKVRRLSHDINSKLMKSLEAKPGLLSLSLAANPKMKNPFVVPGGRFNEMYGWDSYFIILGLLKSGRGEVAFSMLKHLIYQIKHYGKILNANRSYYLSRSQPPLLTSIINELLPYQTDESWLKEALSTAIFEYFNVWASGNRLTENGLSRYYGESSKEPIEVEPHHFDSIYAPFAQEKNLSVKDYRQRFIDGTIKEPRLDLFFTHDCSMRESGHDTTYRLLSNGANLNTVDLNSLLYKYEKDIAVLIQDYFGGRFEDDSHQYHTSETWLKRAESRAEKMTALMWSENDGLFFDYDFKRNKTTHFKSATTFYPLFAGLATQHQADSLFSKALLFFETKGGIVSTTKTSRGPISSDRPQRQWDYPFGWAPHQMIFWQGCLNYNQAELAHRLVYKWLYMMVCESRDYNGVITEKYDVVQASHQLEAEYGNVGEQFDYYPRGGFGWSNASFLVGIDLLPAKDYLALCKQTPPSYLFE